MGNRGTELATGRCGGRSRRRAGEQEGLSRARAPGGDGGVVPILGSIEEVTKGAVDDEAELGRRR
jgi:hypothetical protein